MCMHADERRCMIFCVVNMQKNTMLYMNAIGYAQCGFKRFVNSFFR